MYSGADKNPPRDIPPQLAQQLMMMRLQREAMMEAMRRAGQDTKDSKPADMDPRFGMMPPMMMPPFNKAPGPEAPSKESSLPMLPPPMVKQMLTDPRLHSDLMRPTQTVVNDITYSPHPVRETVKSFLQKLKDHKGISSCYRAVRFGAISGSYLRQMRQICNIRFQNILAPPADLI